MTQKPPARYTNTHEKACSISNAKKELRIFYKGAPIEKTYIPDFHCYGKIIVEIKAVNELTKEPIAKPHRHEFSTTENTE